MKDRQGSGLFLNLYDDLTAAGGAILDIVRAWPNGNLTGVLGEIMVPERLSPM